MADSDVIGGIENLTDAVSGETPSYEYKNPNTDMMKAISKCIDAADGTIGSEYHYDNPNTDVIQKMDELADAIATHSGGGSSILITKTVTENGAYKALDDSADGYSEVTVNVAGNLSRLVYLECVVKDSQVIPPVKTLLKEGDFDTYLSFNDSTKKFTVLTGFNAIVVPWVRQNETAVNAPKGYFYMNDTEVYSYTASSRYANAKGGVRDYIKFTAGDIFWVKSDYYGYPQQFLKVYLIDSAVTDFSNEES